MSIHGYFFRYTQYLNHFDSAVATINDLRTNRAFYEFLAKKQSTLGNDLMSFLIMPVQRLPRYRSGRTH